MSINRAIRLTNPREGPQIEHHKEYKVSTECWIPSAGSEDMVLYNMYIWYDTRYDTVYGHMELI